MWFLCDIWCGREDKIRKRDPVLPGQRHPCRTSPQPDGNLFVANRFLPVCAGGCHQQIHELLGDMFFLMNRVDPKHRRSSPLFQQNGG